MLDERIDALPRARLHFVIMNIEEYFDFLRPDDIRLKGTRIGIESILYEYLHRGRTPEEITARFHTVTLEQVYATILYYLQNNEAVTRYVADWLEWSRAMREEQERNPSPAITRLRSLKAGWPPQPVESNAQVSVG